MKTRPLFSRENFLALGLFLLCAGGAFAQNATLVGNTVQITWGSSGGNPAYVAVRNTADYPNGPTVYTPIYGTTTSGGSGSYVLSPGQSVMVSYFCNPTWNGFAAQGPFEYVGQDCKAKMPSITNTTAYAIHYRLVHSIDGVVTTVIVQPGQTVSASEYDVTCGGNYHIEWQSPDAAAAEGAASDGVWNNVDGSEADPEAWEPGESVPDGEPGDPDAPVPPVPTPTDSNGDPLPPDAPPPATPWGEPTAPTTDNERLDKTTYKQGVAKIVAELQEQTKLMKPGDPTEAKTLYEAAATAALQKLEVEAGKINAAMPSNFTSAPGASTTEAGASDAIYTASVPGEGPAKLMGSNSIVFSPGAIAPNWKTWAGWFREAMLFGLGVGFCVFMQRKFELYYLAWWGVTEKTTKPEPSQAIPGVGWGKQLATALFVTATFVATVAIVITAVNSNLATLIGGGTSITNAMSGIVTDGNALFTALGVIYSFMNAFIPIAAIIQFMVAQYTISWTMAPLWTLALAVAKYFNI